MKRFDELLIEFLTKREIVSFKRLGLHDVNRHPDMKAYQRASDNLYNYVASLINEKT